MRLILIAALLGANILMLLASAYSLYHSRQQYEQGARRTTQNITGALNQRIADSIDKVDLVLQSVLDEIDRPLAAQGGDVSIMADFLSRHAARLPELESIRVADAQGRVIFGKGLVLQQGVTWADREHFLFHRDHAAGGLYVSKPLMGRIAKKYIISISRRYNHADGSFAGVVAATIPVDYLTQLLTGFDLGPKGTLVLRAEDMAMITRFPPIADSRVGEVSDTTTSPELREFVRSGARVASFYTPKSADGMARIFTVQHLEKTPMMVLSGMAAEDYLAPWTVEAYKTLALLLSLMVISAFAGRFMLGLIAQAEGREKRLRQSENQLNHAQRIARLGSFEWDPYGGTFQWSHELFRLWGWEPLSFVPSYALFRQRIHPEDVALVEDAIQQALFAQASYACEHRVVWPDGSVHVMRNEGEMVFSEAGKALRMIGTIQEITAQKQAQDALHSAKEAAEAASHAKSAFIAMMSHELRTPMNGILGIAEVLLMGELSDEQRQYAEIIFSSGNSLQAVLNDILDFSKVDAGKLALTLVPSAPQTLLDESAALYIELARSKGLRLETHWLGSGGDNYQIDPVRLRQMLANLIGNAVKFTEQGFVRVEAREIECSAGSALLEFAVLDSGIGIPEDKQAQLFKPFFQVDSSNTRKYGGTGLGLSIVERLARLMGGAVGVKGQVGGGSCFWFTIRAAVVREAGAASSEPTQRV